MENSPVELKQSLHAPIAQVYRAFTNGMALREWLCNIATVQPRPGGRFYLAWDSGYYTSGEYLAVEPEKSVEFSWHGRGEPGETRVQVQMESRADCTELSLVHTGIGDGEGWKGLAEKFNHDWTDALENLVSVLEKGPDLRITRRPMLGIYLGDFTEEQAKRLGVPVKEGVRLDSVLEGRGAQLAGLQKDDVIVEMDGKPIKPGPDIYQILSQHKAGDTLEVNYYRGNERKTAHMTLSARQIPEIPDTAQALADALAKQYSEAFTALETVLAGTTDERASHKPAPGEWNAKQILAHLIHSERFNFFWITELFFAQERTSDEYGDNLTALVDATVAQYPTVPALLDELKRKNAEVIQLIRTLPADFAAHKGTFWRMAFALPEYAEHINTHMEQIKNVIRG